MSTKPIRIDDVEGTPQGVYDVTYYYVRNGKVRAARDFDRNVGKAYVTRIRLEPHEIARARCCSQPGGCTLFGSLAAQAAWSRQQQEVTPHNPIDPNYPNGWLVDGSGLRVRPATNHEAKALHGGQNTVLLANMARVHLVYYRVSGHQVSPADSDYPLLGDVELRDAQEVTPC